MLLLCTQNKGHGWSLQVVCSCHMFVWNLKYVLKGSSILLGVFAKYPTSSIRLVVISYFSYSPIVCFSRVWSPMAMGTLNMPIMVWILTLAMLTTWLINLHNSCTISRSRRFTLPVPFLMVVERHPFMRQCFRGKKFVCRHCRNHLVNPHSENHCLQLSMFNLIIMLKTTNIDIYFVFGHCSWQKTYSKRCLCLS